MRSSLDETSTVVYSPIKRSISVIVSIRSAMLGLNELVAESSRKLAEKPRFEAPAQASPRASLIP